MENRLKLHIVDYILNKGDGERFVEKIIDGLPENEVDITLVSAGETVDRYRMLANRLSRPVRITETPSLVHRFAVALKTQAQFAGQDTHEVLPQVFHEADLVWFPSIHFHLVQAQPMVKAVASFQENTAVEWGEFLAEKLDPLGSAAATAMMAMQDTMNRRLMSSLARITTNANRTATMLAKGYGPLLRAPDVIPLPFDRLQDIAAESVGDLTLPPRFILYAADLSPTMNHELLLMALARVKTEHPDRFLPLVLSGQGSHEVATGSSYRGSYLKALAEHLKLEIGRDIYLLGVLSDGRYKSLLGQARAAVIPALSDQGMALAADAALLGTPIAGAETDILREHLDRLGTEASWFRPDSVDDLATVLVRLGNDEGADRAPSLSSVTWKEAAQKYLTLMREQAMFASLHQKYAEGP